MQVRDELGATVFSLLEDVVRWLREASPSDSVSMVAAAVLRRLSTEGPHRLTDLARKERTSQPGMTQLIGRLERAGLVRRSSAPGDGRGVVVEVTTAGRRTLDRDRQRHVAALNRLLDRLDDDDRAAVAAAATAFGTLFDAAGDIDPAAVRSG
jgi:DNA-binding MarR family transcriptional regulator